MQVCRTKELTNRRKANHYCHWNPFISLRDGSSSLVDSIQIQSYWKAGYTLVVYVQALVTSAQLIRVLKCSISHYYMQLLNRCFKAGREKKLRKDGVGNTYFPILHFCLQLVFFQSHNNPHREDFCFFCLLSIILVTVLSSVSVKNQKGKNNLNLEENKWKCFN